jgi:PKD repeat protein
MKWRGEEDGREVRLARAIFVFAVAAILIGIWLAGCDKIHINIPGLQPPLKVDLTFSCAGCETEARGPAPLVVLFTAQANRDGVRYEWDFGDGYRVEAGPIAGHLYAYPGEYTATVRVTDPEDEATAEASVTITVTESIPDVVTKLIPSNSWLGGIVVLPRVIQAGEPFAGYISLVAQSDLSYVNLHISGVGGCFQFQPDSQQWAGLSQGAAWVFRFQGTALCQRGDPVVWVYLTVAAETDGDQFTLQIPLSWAETK